ncbi:hypothetical protein CEQ90_11455 [Lewinellaceae bacterium SD302]|nr:hypothetical protein CEQ90_11455 [Lewinellaceae bacterium SD302]
MFSSLPSGGLSQSQAQIAGNSIQSFVGKAEFCYAEAVSVASLYQMLVNNDSVNLVVPGKTSTGPMILNVGHLESQDTSNFLVRGTINDDITSYASLRVVQGALLGSMGYKGENYSITAALPGLSVLHQICHDTTSTGPTCTTVGVDNTGGGSSGSSAPVQNDKDRDVVNGTESITNNNCFDSYMRILVMFTNAAEATGLDMNQTAQAAVDQLNLILQNTGLSIRADLAGVSRFNEFNENVDPNLDGGDRINSDMAAIGADVLSDPTDDLPIQPNQVLNAIIESDRISNAADYVAIFTGNVYEGIGGAAGQILDTETIELPSGENQVNILQESFGPPAYKTILSVEQVLDIKSFPHELGHLFGAAHESTPWTRACEPDDDSPNFDFDAPLVQAIDGRDPAYAHASMAYDCDLIGRSEMYVTNMFSVGGIEQKQYDGWNLYYL